MRLLLYTGKGGVGKTTTAAATAVRAAEVGQRTLVLSADAAHSLGDVTGGPLGPEPSQLAPSLWAVEVDTRVELARHWGSIQQYLVSLFRYQGIEEVVSEELALLPGAEEVTTLLAVERYARSRKFDLIVVDCAPTDSTLRLVTLPEVAHSAVRMLLRLQRAVSTVVSPLAGGVVPVPLPSAEVFRDAEQLIYKRLRTLRKRLVSDSTSVRIVVTPERMVIDEARRAYTDLCLFDLACDAVVMNRMFPAEAGDEPFFAEWMQVQASRRAEVEAHFAPLPVLDGVLADDEVIGLDALSAHGERLFGARMPHDCLARPERLRFESRSAGSPARAVLPLPGARADDLDVAKVEDELVISTAGVRRAIKLPRALSRQTLADASLRDGMLRVEFTMPTSHPNSASSAGTD